MILGGIKKGGYYEKSICKEYLLSGKYLVYLNVIMIITYHICILHTSNILYAKDYVYSLKSFVIIDETRIISCFNISFTYCSHVIYAIAVSFACHKTSLNFTDLILLFFFFLSIMVFKTILRK